MNKQILVVDNHPVMFELTSSLLEKEGYQVLTAETGLATTKVLRTYTPEVIITDLEMRNFNGDKLCRN